MITTGPWPRWKRSSRLTLAGSCPVTVFPGREVRSRPSSWPGRSRPGQDDRRWWPPLPSALPSHLLFGRASARGPAERVEDGHGVEVVPPVHHLAVAQGQNRDVAVTVGGAGGDDLACGGVLQDGGALSGVAV